VKQYFALLEEYKGKTRKKKWADIILSDTSLIPGMREWRRRAEDREKWRRLLRETMTRKGL